jgi:hypothetical protein
VDQKGDSLKKQGLGCTEDALKTSVSEEFQQSVPLSVDKQTHHAQTL